jgi:hypothetical protein
MYFQIEFNHTFELFHYILIQFSKFKTKNVWYLIFEVRIKYFI